MFHVKQLSSDQKQRLEKYSSLLIKWNQRINLIGRSTIEDLWQRHIIDSAQLVNFIGQGSKQIADLGSGAGLPGVVLSILTNHKLTLIESDKNKCVFLRQVKRELDLDIDIVEDRIENIKDTKFDVIVSRAMASVDKILNLGYPLLHPEGNMVLLKGESHQMELDDASHKWQFEVAKHNSQTNNDGAILVLDKIRKRT